MQYLTIDTPLGEVNFFVFGVTNAVSIHIDSKELSPVLLPGMSVKRCLGILLKVHCKESIEDLIFECRLLEQKYFYHGHEGGEHLHAYTWKNEHSILMIGTEDDEALKTRLPEKYDDNSYPIGGSEKGLSIYLPKLMKGDKSSFHFIAAWNDLPEPEDGSCWFAVDQKHSDLLKK